MRYWNDGSYESILGREIDPVIGTSLSFEPFPFDVARGDVRLAGTWVDADPETGKCLAIGRIQWPLALLQQWEAELAERQKQL